MSAKSTDYYRRLCKEEELDSTRQDTEEVNEEIEETDERAEELQGMLADTQATRQGMETRRDDLQQRERALLKEIEELKVIEQTKPISPSKKNAEKIMDPFTGTRPGEELEAPEEHMEYWEAVNTVRCKMSQGDIVGAREADIKATKLLQAMEDRVDPRLLSQSLLMQPEAITAYIASEVEFLKARSLPKDENDLEMSLKYAIENPDKTKPDMGMNMLNIFLYELMGSHRDKLPEGVCDGVLSEVMEERIKLQKWDHQNKVEERRRQHNNGSEDDDDDDEEEDNDEGEIPPFVWDHKGWEAVLAAVRARHEQKKKINDRELTLPCEESAPICRYNHEAHFNFKSDEGRDAVHPLDDALVRCKLRERPSSSSSSTSDEKLRLPIFIDYADSIDFDIDGDVMVMCGDVEHMDFRSSRTYLGFLSVPCMANLSSANRESDLRDASGRYYINNFNHACKSRNHYFVKCIADDSSRAWAVCGRTGSVNGFSISPDLTKWKERPVGLLKFNAEEIKKAKQFVIPCYNIARYGPCIVGSAGSNRLSFWDSHDAVAEFESKHCSIEIDEDSYAEESEGETDAKSPARKRQKHASYKGMLPKVVDVEDDPSMCFRSGDIQWTSSTQLLIAPLGSADASTKQFSSVRLFDVTSESVVAYFSGHQSSDISIGKQHCVDAYNCIFTNDSAAAYVWDTRSYCPVITLKPRGSGRGVLGVPGGNNMTAFTFGDRRSECITCWDLRMPACHSYTMATGNNYVRKLLWHSPTSSLLASTTSEHGLSYGRYGAFSPTGEVVNDFDLDEYESEWPHGARFEPTYFSPRKDCQFSFTEPAIIQYPFENGREMHERFDM